MKTPRFLRLSALALLLACLLAPHARAQNDTFASPTVLVGNPLLGPLVGNGTTVGATKEAGEPNHGFNAGGSSIWFEWTAPAAGAVRVSLSGSDFDTTMGIYVGSAVDSLGVVNLNDDGDGSMGIGVFSEVLLRPVAGTTYRIGVDGWNDGAAIATGSVTLTLSAAPPGPANDDLANAQNLGGAFPLNFFGGTNVNATREDGEPFYTGRFGAASVWYAWTAPASVAVEINTIGSDYRTYLGVFTGNAYDGLATVAEDATRGANRVNFNAVAGTTYRIAVEGAADGIQHFGTIGLNIVAGTETTVLPFGSSWSWLHPTDGADPAGSDPDFDATWFHPVVLGYNGPAFSPPSPGLLGYGAIDFGPIATNIGSPASGLRYAAYFVRDINLAVAIPHAVADILADDGAAVYVDGADVARVNFSAFDIYFAGSDAVGSESATSRVSLGSLAAGARAFAVSVHNQSPASSDLGFDFRLIEVIPDFGAVTAGAATTGFEEPPAGATSYLGRRLGIELGFVSTGGGGAAVRDTASGRALEITAVANAVITTETIDTRNFTDVTASIDLRTFDLGTGFEATDNLRAVVEGSTDGVAFSPVADLIPLISGGRELVPPSDGLIVYSGGGFTTFSLPAGVIPEAVRALRVVVTTTADSPNEHIILDNLVISGTPVPPPSSLRITSFTGSPAAGISITIASEPGKSYRLQSSGNLIAWANGELKPSGGATTTFTVPGPLPAAMPGWFRVAEE